MKISQRKISWKSVLVLGIIIFISFLSGGRIARVHAQETPNYIFLPVVMNKYPFLPVFGIALDRLDSSTGMDMISGAGATWTRAGFIWSAIEPQEGARNWDASLEQKLVDLGTRKIQPIMLIEGTPGWALKNGFICGAVAEDKFPALGQFAYDLVKRYSAAPYNVRYWELWNEPDVTGLLGCWGDPSDNLFYGGYYYGQMLKAVYPQMKAADPGAQVLVGGLLLDCDPNNPPAGQDCLPAKFLNGILASGAGPYFDGASFHAYDFYTGMGTYGNDNWHSSSSTTGPVSIAKGRYLKGLLAQYGYGEKYLVSTETAVFYGKNVMDPPCDPNAPVDVEVTKVDYVIHSYAAAVAEGLKANIWFSALGVRCSGLLKSDLTPKAAYYAYQFAEQELGEAVFMRAIGDYGQVMGYEYETPGKKLWVVWSLDGQVHPITLPAQPLEVSRVGVDGLAVQETNDISLTVDSSPRFIEFSR